MTKAHSSIMLDTHKFVKRLINQAIPEAQAEEIVDIIKETQEIDRQNLISKTDVELVFDKLVKEFEVLKQEIQKLELRMTIKLGTMIAFIASLVATFFKYL